MSTATLCQACVPFADSAALHPRFMQGEGGYFAECAVWRKALKCELRRAFSLEHDLVIVPNTTAGLFSLLLGQLAQTGGTIACDTDGYPPYLAWCDAVAAQRTGELFNGPTLRLISHISPVTGRINELSMRDVEGTLEFVDAAQSFGTALHADLVARATLFVAPLHKHVGVATGLGIVAIRWSDIPAGQHNLLRTLCEIIEHGCQDVALLRGATEYLRATPPTALFNTARILVSERLQETANTMGLELVTPIGLQAHLVSFRVDRVPGISADGRVAGVQCKYFPDRRVLRFSYHSQLHGDSPRGLEEHTMCLLGRLGSR